MATAADEFIIVLLCGVALYKAFVFVQFGAENPTQKVTNSSRFFQLLIIRRHLLCFAIGDAELRTLDKESFTDSSFRNAVFYTVRIYKYVGCYGFFSRVQINSKVGRTSKCLDMPSKNM